MFCVSFQQCKGCFPRGKTNTSQIMSQVRQELRSQMVSQVRQVLRSQMISQVHSQSVSGIPKLVLAYML